MRTVALLVLAVLPLACATRDARRTAEPPTWVLVRSPIAGEFGTPIYAWERVRTFPTAEECATYRAELLENAVSAASRTKLEEAYRLNCMPASKMTPR